MYEYNISYPGSINGVLGCTLGCITYTLRAKSLWCLNIGNKSISYLKQIDMFPMCFQGFTLLHIQNK